MAASSVHNGKKGSLTPATDPARLEEVLRRLQDTAKPEPIKVACLHTPPDKPEHLDEGYHGKITKEDVAKLLCGKTGRYLVRESISKPGDIVLSMNFDEEIKHYRLLYDGQTYKTDASESGFESITELLIHVLELCRKCKEMESKKKPKSVPHQFESHTYLHPKWCEICGGFLWGLRYQGMKCEFCGMSVHKGCKGSVPDQCSKGQYGKTDRSQSLTPSMRTKTTGRASPPQQPVKSPDRKLSSKYSCYYFNKSIRFLTHNYSPRLFDLENNLNKCYCEECLVGPRVRQGLPKTSMSVNLSTKMLQNWCRFPICPPSSIRRDLKELEVAYLASNPEDLKTIMDGWASGSDQSVESALVVPSMAYLNELLTPDNMSSMFRDALDNEIKPVQTVLEIFIEPGSFEVKYSKDGYRMNATDERNGLSGDNGSPTFQPEVWEIKGKSKIFPGALLIRILRERTSSSPR